IGRSEIVCVLRAEHPLAQLPAVTLGDMAGQTVISYRPDSLPGMLIDRALARDGTRLRADVEIDVSIIAVSFVLQGLGIALVDGLVPWTTFPGLVARPFRPTVSLPLCLLTSSQRPLSRNQELLRKYLRDAVKSYAEDPGSQSILMPLPAA